MKKIIAVTIIVVLLLGVFYLLKGNPPTSTITKNGDNNIVKNSQNPDDVERVAVIAQNLDTPWGLVFLPDNSILFTERKGDIRKIDPNGNLIENPITTLSQVKEIGEGGLLGIDIHPDFKSNNYVYIYYTFSGSGNRTLNRVSRFKYENDSFNDEQIIIDNIPGAPNHNGGRIKFGPDNNLYIGTGDAQEPSHAQDKNLLAGKILRVTDLGKAAVGNPFGNAIYSYGHRNVQGLTWDDKGNFWATEHGRSTPTGFDELNLIKSGGNYGWPDIQGDEVRSGMMPPIKNSGSSNTWAPSGIAYIGGSAFFGGLRGQALYESKLNGESAGEIYEHFKNEFGRIRDVVVGPDGMLYITTSNRDGRGTPDSMDDKIIRINPAKI